MYSKRIKRLTLLVFFAITAFWTVTLFKVATSAIPYNSTSRQVYNKDYLLFRSLLPEGFSFFTRDPREPLVILVAKDSHQEVELHNNAPEFFFGFIRYPRAVNLEMSVIWATVRDQEWYECESGGNDCFDDSQIPHYVIKSSFPDPMLIGDYYLKVTEPVPWAWANSFKNSERAMPCKVVSIRIDSSGVNDR